ncbi:DUF1311 domain-containing protein [Alphaproteobacteria bacterium KMM 3653]|uniref:DUF1311 domain-containing protein n=1 Tax=Harenicola maris TaxID=2841044 RepID=A0AAP2CS77_9RHOB|nr:DUF1311 domain-containing protein [Harenicola maris]
MALALLLCAAARPAQAEITVYGPFWHSSELPNVLTLTGDIQPPDSTHLRRALDAEPIDTLFLLSPGGNVSSALSLSQIVRNRGLATVIPAGEDCASACSFLFVAGVKRRAYGRLGVHQFSSGGRVQGAEAEESAQSLTARIMARLQDYEVSNHFIVKMLETPHTSIYWFNTEELRREGIETLNTFPKETAAFPAIYASAKSSVPGGDSSPYTATQTGTTTPKPPPQRTPPATTTRKAEPSFNCAYATQPTELTLCENADLADLDREMAAQYRRIRAGRTFSQTQALIAAQKAWLRRRNSCKTDVACLQSIYQTRITELSN